MNARAQGSRVAAVVWSLVVALLGACAGPQAGAALQGHYRALGPQALHVRVGGDGLVEVLDPATGERFGGRAQFASGRGITLVLGDGRVLSVGRSLGSSALAMSIGSTLYSLTPLPAEQFEAGAPAARTGGAEAGAGGIRLAGMRLAAAEGSLGGYRDLHLFDFCSDGRFHHESLIAGPGVGGQRTSQGQWRASGAAALSLTYSDGRRQTLALRQVEERVIQLDQRKYSVEVSRRCR